MILQVIFSFYVFCTVWNLIYLYFWIIVLFELDLFWIDGQIFFCSVWISKLFILFFNLSKKNLRLFGSMWNGRLLSTEIDSRIEVTADNGMCSEWQQGKCVWHRIIDCMRTNIDQQQTVPSKRSFTNHCLHASLLLSSDFQFWIYPLFTAPSTNRYTFHFDNCN